MHGDLTKRDAILDSAARLLAGGYENTSMDAVAADAGVSKTTVYAHFSDKLELFKAVMAAGAAKFGENLEAALRGVSGEEPSERLATTLVEVLKAATVPEFLGYFRVLITETERRAQLTGGFEEVHAGVPTVVDVIAELLVAEAATAGYEIADPDRFAALLLRMTTSVVQLDMLLADYHPDAQLLETHARYVVQVFLRGIRPEPGEGRTALPAGYDYPWGPALFRQRS